MGGRVCRCRRPAQRAWTVWRPWTSLLTRLCLETSSTATTTTPKRARRDRSSGPRSGKHARCWWNGAYTGPFGAQQGDASAGFVFLVSHRTDLRNKTAPVIIRAEQSHPTCNLRHKHRSGTGENEGEPINRLDLLILDQLLLWLDTSQQDVTVQETSWEADRKKGRSFQHDSGQWSSYFTGIKCSRFTMRARDREGSVSPNTCSALLRRVEHCEGG